MYPPGGADSAWRVGLLDPDGGFLGVMPMEGGSAVTSGDYQRFYIVDGVRYGHIIDPATLYPARNFRQVTVIGPDSGEADFLSTALFILPYEKGRALAESLGYDALWVFADGSTAATDGAAALMYK